MRSANRRGVDTDLFEDQDGDGYGDASSSVEECQSLPGYVSDDTDCDDADAAINPGAAEICDGFDNDCDGLVDADDLSVSGLNTYFVDSDSDGFGDSNSLQDACVQPSGLRLRRYGLR